MTQDADKALKLWGRCHQLRNEPDLTPDEIRKSKARNLATLQDLAERCEREMDLFRSPERKAAIQKRYEKALQRANKPPEGFGAAPIPTGTRMYAPAPVVQKVVDDPEPAAFIFLTIENYFKSRPMQRAIAWRIYVETKSVRGFTYRENERTICGAARSAYRLHRNLKRNIERLFEVAAFEETVVDKKARELAAEIRAFQSRGAA